MVGCWWWGGMVLQLTEIIHSSWYGDFLHFVQGLSPSSRLTVLIPSWVFRKPEALCIWLPRTADTPSPPEC